jgi:hypothetical protein
MRSFKAGIHIRQVPDKTPKKLVFFSCYYVRGYVFFFFLFLCIGVYPWIWNGYGYGHVLVMILCLRVVYAELVLH